MKSECKECVTHPQTDQSSVKNVLNVRHDEARSRDDETAADASHALNSQAGQPACTTQYHLQL